MSWPQGRVSGGGRARTGHQYLLWATLDTDATEGRGEVYGRALRRSGSWRVAVAQLPAARVQITGDAGHDEPGLSVGDDGWFGDRTSDRAGLGERTPDPDRFPAVAYLGANSPGSGCIPGTGNLSKWLISPFVNPFLRSRKSHPKVNHGPTWQTIRRVTADQ